MDMYGYKMYFAVILVLFVVQNASAVIYTLNETAYEALPALYEVEDYASCMRARSAYCSVDARLVANESSALLTTIQEFSLHTTTHFDRRVVHRGMCVRSCRAGGASRALRLEACLNETLYRTHGLQVKVIEEKCMEPEGPGLDAGDCVVAALALLLLLLAAAGSLQDLWAAQWPGGKVLECFSLQQNWRRLVAPSGDGPDPNLRRLKCFNGVKLLTTILVILAHSPVANMSTTHNAEYFEQTYHKPMYAIIYNGPIIVQTFFVLSGFLLSYNVLRQPRVTWDLLPKGTILRWLRLTPPYAMVLAFVCTWQRHTGDGPFWETLVGVEVADCRRDWIYSLLYVNNYIDGSQCIAQAWYLAADMQLSVLGLIVLCAARSERARRWAAGALLALGVIAPAARVYWQDLNAVLIVTPEVARKFFVLDPTFNNLYKRGDTNIACYVLGLVLGEVVLRLQDQNFDISKYKKYRPLYWALVPFGFLQLISGAVFYIDGLTVPLAVRVVYSSAIKLLFGLTAFCFFLGAIFKLENTYRRILEWRALSAPARLAYCAFLVHATVLRNTGAAHTTLVNSSDFSLFLNYIAVLVLSFLIAVPCWMLVEAPAAQLVKLAFMGTSKSGKPSSKPSSIPSSKASEQSEPTHVVMLDTKEIIDVRL